jgi:FkbM family methyltransferase
MMTAADALARFFPPGGPPVPLWLVDVGVGGGREAHDLVALWPELRVVGLEPSPELYEASREGYPGKLLPWGAWGHAREHRLRHPGDPRSGSVYLPLPGGPEVVTLRPLDELIPHVGTAPRSVVLWADVEGAELEALRGAWELLRSGAVAVLNLEVRPAPLAPGACSEADVSAFLAGFGYAQVMKYNTHGGGDPHADAVYAPADWKRCW